MQNIRTRATLIALALLFTGARAAPLAAQERPLGEEVERGERARVQVESRARVYRDSADGIRVYRHDGTPDSSHARFLYRTSLRTSCARMGISFMGDDTIRVHEVLPRSGAAEAGVRAGDIIVSVQGEPANRRTMAELSENLEAGDRVRLVVRRDGRVQNLDVTAREDVCPYRTMLSESPLRLLCMKRDSTDADEAEVCTRGNLMELRSELEALHRELPWRIQTERADSGVWLRYRSHEGPGDSVFIDLDSVRIMSHLALEHLDSLRHLIPFAYHLADSITHLLPSIRVELHEADEAAHAGALMLRSLELGARALAGAQLTDLNPDLAEYFEAERGVLVTNVERGTPAARAGLQGGDVIVAVNGNEVEDVGDVRRHTAEAEGTIELTIQRRGERRTVSLTR